MIPKLHAKGSSFKGAAAYLLHDKDGAATSDRVGWTETVNLATANPQAAWRVMAATALDASRLKEQAGVKKTGRVSKEPVLHLTLSWAPGQTPSREEMSGFARRAIKALKAGDRQAMIVCHTDEQHPHVHVLLNRVSPADGRMLSSSNEKLALSALALAYEKEKGAVQCKQREINAQKRAKGEYVRAERDIPRPEFEAMRDGQKEVEKEISAQFLKDNPRAAAALRATLRRRIRAQLDAIKQQMRPQWQGIYQRQQGEVENWQTQKASFLQRLRDWIGGEVKKPSVTLTFQRASLHGADDDKKLGVQKQRDERAALVKNYKAQAGRALGDIKTACREAVRQMFTSNDRSGGIAAQFRSAALGITPTQLSTQAPVQRALSELAGKFSRLGKSSQPKATTPGKSVEKDKDRGYEP